MLLGLLICFPNSMLEIYQGLIIAVNWTIGDIVQEIGKDFYFELWCVVLVLSGPQMRESSLAGASRNHERSALTRDRLRRRAGFSDVSWSTTRRAGHRAHCTLTSSREIPLQSTSYPASQFRVRSSRPRGSSVHIARGTIIFSHEAQLGSTRFLSRSMIHFSSGWIISQLANTDHVPRARSRWGSKEQLDRGQSPRRFRRRSRARHVASNRMHEERTTWKRERKREKRERGREYNISGREGSAREFAGRLKHGSVVSRPHTRNSTRLRRTSPPSPSALPWGQGMVCGRRGWNSESGAPAPGESVVGSTRCTRGTCHSALFRCAIRVKELILGIWLINVWMASVFLIKELSQLMTSNFSEILLTSLAVIIIRNLSQVQNY